MARQSKREQPQNVRIPLIGSMTNRDSSASKDQRFINIFPETRKVDQIESTKIFLNKRPGLEEYRDYGTGEGRGVIYFNGKLYVAVGNKLYEDAVSPVEKITFTGSTGHVGMVLGNSASTGDYLFVCDGTSGWVINTAGTATLITDADFPTPHIPTPVFIDGYIALAKGIDVYTCTLDTPTAWVTSDYLSAELFPDSIKSLARQNNQVVVFGSTSTEFFFDAANASGSPFSRNDAATLQMGIAAEYAVYQNEKFLIFVGQSDSGGRAVWLVEGFQAKRISDEYIDRCINAEEVMTDVRGYGIRTMGHLFYVLNLPTTNRTFVFDVDEKLWHEWSTSSSGSHTVFAYNYATDTGSGYSYLLHISNGKLYKLNPTLYQDAGTDIITQIVTNRYDMDTIKRKFMSNLRVVGDRYSDSNSVDVYWTDDDYQSWSNAKTITLNDDFPNFARLGAFRRRAFKIVHTGNYPLRLESIEVTFQEGIH